jgi:hypothetical protein
VIVRLTAHMRQALITASHQDGLRRTHETLHGQPPWPAPPMTLHALNRRGLVTYTRILNRKGDPVDIWRITEAGRQALNPPARNNRHRPRFLQREIWRGGDYTTNHRVSIDSDIAPGNRRTAVEVILTDEDLTRFAAAATRRRKRVLRDNGTSLDQQTIEQRLEQVTLAAGRSHFDVHSEIRLIRFMHNNGREHAALSRLTVLEARLSQRAA